MYFIRVHPFHDLKNVIDYTIVHFRNKMCFKSTRLFLYYCNNVYLFVIIDYDEGQMLLASLRLSNCSPLDSMKID